MADGELFNYHRRMIARLIPLAALMLTGCLAGEKVRRGSDLREPDEAKRTFASCPGADALVRAGKRLADGMRAPWQGSTGSSRPKMQFVSKFLDKLQKSAAIRRRSLEILANFPFSS